MRAQIVDVPMWGTNFATVVCEARPKPPRPKGTAHIGVEAELEFEDPKGADGHAVLRGGLQDKNVGSRYPRNGLGRSSAQRIPSVAAFYDGQAPISNSIAHSLELFLAFDLAGSLLRRRHKEKSIA